MPKHITQAGLNRVIWKMLAALGGKFTISDREINRATPDAIRIDWDGATQTFVLTLCKAKEETSLIMPNCGIYP